MAEEVSGGSRSVQSVASRAREVDRACVGFAAVFSGNSLLIATVSAVILENVPSSGTLVGEACEVYSLLFALAGPSFPRHFF